MTKKIIGVIGQGFVGGALTQVMSRYYDVWVYDIAGKVAPGGIVPNINKPVGRIDSVAELVQVCEGNDRFTGVFFVCLPTPMKKTGECDVSIVQGVLDEMAAIPGFVEHREHLKEEHRGTMSRVAVVKSTVPPGTVAMWNERYAGTALRVVFNPEFLTEANAVRDFETQDRIILGGPRPFTGQVKRVFEVAFDGVDIITTSSTIAETVKYLTNCFLATKVAFANEMKQVCDKVDADYDKVIEYAKYDKRLGTSHWSVPGPDGALGFGGHCFPKDLNALIHVATAAGVETPVLQGVWKKNLEVRSSSDRDWERMKGRAVVD